ncbi:MAG TPA: hypothetical protein VH021_15725 [Trebonia sp.]|nr:hypothetical protein [Trebonia sp.]
MSERVANAVATGDGGPAGSGWSRRIGRPGPRLLWAGGLLLAAVGLFTLYLFQSGLGPFNSDGASMVLQAQAMLHGNPLLKGWRVADVSFYTTELPEYMVVTALRGLRPDVVHISGALTYTLTVLLAAFLARGRATGRAGAIRALLAGAIMLAPGIAGGTEVFLENPDHAGTAVPILVLLLLLDRAPERWYVPAGVCLLLAWVQVADQLTLIAATAPVAAVAGVRLLVLAARRRPRSEFRYDGLLLAAAVVSVALASVAERAIRHLGGFRQSPLVYGLLAPVSQIPANVRMTGRTLLLLFGANNQAEGHGGTHQLLEISAHIHLIGLALAVAGFAVAVFLFFTARMDRVTQIVAAAAAATLAAGIFGTVLPDLAHAHEVAILLPLGAVLAGRMLPPLASSARWRPVRAAAVALGAWLAVGLAALCFAASQAPAPPTNQQLANWLVAHHYTDGVAGYWQSNSVTVASGGRVQVAPISYSATGQWSWESAADWYQASNRRADFVVAVADPTAVGYVTTAAARRSFGAPARQYQVGQYVVMVYDYNLLTRLG